MDLFDIVAKQRGCMITDLKYSAEHRLRTADVAAIADETFSIGDWEALVSYLYETPLHFATVAEAKAYLDTPWLGETRE